MLNKLFGVGDLAKPIEAAGKAFDDLFTSDEERLDKKTLLERIKQQPHALLNKLLQIDANSDDKFSKRARPFCIYIAGLNAFQLTIAVLWFNKNDIPQWFITMTTTAFLGALGIYGALRTLEKLTGKVK